VADHGGQGAVALACALEPTTVAAAAAAGGEAVGRARSVAAVLQDTDLQFCNATVRACRALRDGRDIAALDACSRALDLGGYYRTQELPEPHPGANSRPHSGATRNHRPPAAPSPTPTIPERQRGVRVRGWASGRVVRCRLSGGPLL